MNLVENKMLIQNDILLRKNALGEMEVRFNTSLQKNEVIKRLEEVILFLNEKCKCYECKQLGYCLHS